MRRTIKLFLAFSTLLVTTMCKYYQGGTVALPTGLSCENYTDYRFFEWRGEEYKFYLEELGATCSYTCPDGIVIEVDIPEEFSSSSPLAFASKADLDAQFCGVAPPATPTQPPPTASPTAAASPTLAATATVEPSPTVEITPTAQEPLLTGRVLMCDVGANLINFRIVQPAPDLTGKTITAQINDTESMCAVNPTNPSLLTCTIPAGVTFPARVVVSLDGAVVNDFVYDGLGCVEITTPVATTTP
jgi:hypothetical protein